MDDPNQNTATDDKDQYTTTQNEEIDSELPAPAPINNTAETLIRPEPVVQPPTQPIQQIDTAPTSTIAEPTAINPPLTLVLQWLTYAFWLASAVSAAILTWFVAYHFLSGHNDSSSMIAYSIAAVLSFVVFAVICDLIYIKREPEHKTKGASVIMIIHAVIFALSGVGALFTIIFNLVSLMTDGGGSNYSYSAMLYRPDDYTINVNILSASSGLVFCIILFFRTIAIKKIFKLRKIIVIILAAISLILVGLAVFGPIVSSIATKDDRLIESNLSSIANEIDNYTSSNQALPADLNILSLQGPVKDLVSSNKITYKKEVSSDSSYLRYQLCVTYKNADSSSQYMYQTKSGYNDEYSSYPNTSGHPAGNVCYKLESYLMNHYMDNIPARDINYL